MIQVHTPAAATKLLHAHGAQRREPNFTIFMGKDKHKLNHRLSHNLLPIRHIVYETLVDGIDSVTANEDFKGVLAVHYQHLDAEHAIAFAMWFSIKYHLYFLTSLGQYSLKIYRKEIERFKTGRDSDIHIKLSLIHQSGLDDLESRLAKSNLPRANVCLLENTIDQG